MQSNLLRAWLNSAELVNGGTAQGEEHEQVGNGVVVEVLEIDHLLVAEVADNLKLVVGFVVLVVDEVDHQALVGHVVGGLGALDTRTLVVSFLLVVLGEVLDPLIVDDGLFVRNHDWLLFGDHVREVNEGTVAWATTTAAAVSRGWFLLGGLVRGFDDNEVARAGAAGMVTRPTDIGRVGPVGGVGGSTLSGRLISLLEGSATRSGVVIRVLRHDDNGDSGEGVV